MKRQVITIQEDMVIYAPHHGEVWMTVWEIAELLNVTGTAVKNTIKRIWKQSVLKDFQHQMDTYQALLFRQWFISKVVNRKGFLHLYNIIAYRGNDFCRCTLYAIFVSLL